MRLPVAIILVALLCSTAILSSGCADPAAGAAVGAVAVGATAEIALTRATEPGDVVGVADTKAERQQRIKDVRNIGWRQFVDDWDTFWLQDRGSRLSEYPIR